MNTRRAMRRTLVVGNYLTIGSLVLHYGLFERGMGLQVVYDLSLLIIVLLLLSRIPLFEFVFGETGLINPNPDERQLAQRNRIYALSYRTLIVIAAVCLVGWGLFFKYPVAWFMPTINSPPWTAYADQMFFFLLLAVDLILFLPIALVAWLEPDPISDDTTFRAEARNL